MPDYTVKITYKTYAGIEADSEVEAIERAEAIEESDGFDLGEPEFEVISVA